jgi:hypothetical protein
VVVTFHIFDKTGGPVQIMSNKYWLLLDLFLIAS